MAVTRINNNQITDSSAGNAYVGINAGTKLQNFSITAGKIANNLTYGSDLTITGNLTVQGNSTAIDTTITTIEDPVIVLASTQTGAPAVDIGFIGERGSANNIAFVWNEANSEFVTAFTSTAETSTVISISSYANLHTNNMVIGGTTSLIGNVVGAANFTGNVTGGNLRTPGLISATGGVTASSVAGGVITGTSSSVTGTQTAASTVGGVITGSSSSVTGTQTAASTVGGVITGSSTSVTGSQTAASTVGGVITGSSTSVTGSQTATSTVGGVITGTSTSVTGTTTAASVVGGVITGSSVSVTGNITGGNILFGSGNVSGTGNVLAGYFIGNGSALTGVTATSVNANSLTGTVLNSGVVTSSLTSVGVLTSLSVSGNTTSGNISATNHTGTTVSVTGTVTAASTVGGVITGTSSSVTGSQTAASTVGGVITGTSSSVTGAQTAASTVGGVITGSSTSVTGSQTAASTVGGVITGSSSSVTGTQTAASTVGGVITGASVSVTGNVTGGNLVSATVTNPTAMTVRTNAGNINLEPTGNVVINNTYINGLQLTPIQDQDAASKYYVDQAITTGITIHQSVTAATTTTLAITTGGTVTYAQPNGAANGIGATLTTTGSFNLIDTANVQTANTRILVKDQANAVQNGIYVWSNATVITRSTDADEYGANSTQQFSYNDYFFTTSGNVNAGTAFIVNAPTGTITFGTSNIGFGIFSQSQVYTANTSAGLSLIGTVFSAKVDNNTTAFDGLGNISVKAGANLTTPNIGAATGTSLSVTGAVTAASTVGGVITGSSSSVTGTQTAASTVGGVITGSSLSVTGNVSGGNLNVTGNIVDTGALSIITSSNGNIDLLPNGTGNVNTGANVSVTGRVTAASVVGGVITGSSVSVTGTATAASTVGGVITGSSSSVTGTQTAASTVGGVITGSSTSVTGTQTAASTVGGVITGSSSSVTGNVTGGNVLTGGLISAAANITGGNILTGGQVSAVGNITANIGSFFIGNGSQLTGVTASTSGFPVIAGTSNIAAATNGNIGVTVAGTSNVLTIASTGIFTTGLSSVTGNVTGGNVLTGGLISATANVTGGNVLTGGIVSATANVSGGNVLTGGLISATANVTGGNVLTGGLISSTGNVTAANLILTSGVIDGPAAGRITVNGSDLDTDFAVDGDTVANIFYVDAGTSTASFGNSTQVTNALVTFNSTTSIKIPVGNTAQRPATGITGMQRFNTTNNALEMYYNSAWTDVGSPTFTVIADQQFNGDGVNVAFTLSSTQTTNSCIVSINGVVQIPTLAYAVAGTNPTCVLTFTEAPATGDIIDVRQITTTTSITSISNSAGNAIIGTSATAGNVEITGNIMPTSNATANIGSATLSYNTIFAKATSAQYADLAENYAGDVAYAPGTVVDFGGDQEVTVSTADMSSAVAGVVSTNPSYLMNAGQAGDIVVAVALTGRVPTSVTGTVHKGDLMVSAGNGAARAEANPRVGTVIGKALADSEGSAVIEVVVGRF